MAAERSPATDTASFDRAALAGGTAAELRGPDTRGPDSSVERFFLTPPAVDDSRDAAGRDPRTDGDGDAPEDPDGPPVSAAATAGIAAIAPPRPRPTANAHMLPTDSG